MQSKPLKTFRTTTLNLACSLACLSVLGACSVGPDYVRPTVAETIPTSFKEDWKTAQPQDQVIPAQWWTMFNDAKLNELIEQCNSSNQTLAQAQANYRSASSLVDNAKAAYFPTITGDVSRTRARTYQQGVSTVNSAGISASWELDIWGGVRRAVEVQENSALSSFANMQAVRLSMESQLAQDYFQLRTLDAQKELLDRTVEEYRRSLKLTQNQFKSGIVATDSVLLAETQLKSTEAQAIDVGVQRAQFEHAIATLVGKPASSFSIPVIPVGQDSYMPALPDVPVALPSTLLERRPDVAVAERSAASANAQIGVTKAAFFPSLTLNGSGGYDSSTLSKWISLPNRVWSVGPDLAATLFDGGAKIALNKQAVAAYDASVANYRQTVLSAFQNVEDNLAALRILKDESVVQTEATVAAKKSLVVTMNQFKAGTVNYLNVVTAQTTALTNERADLTITGSRLTATVQLIAALGGGWEGLNSTSTQQVATTRTAAQAPANSAQ